MIVVPFVSATQAASYLGVSVSTFRKLRNIEGFPRPVDVGLPRLKKYSVSELDAWRQKRMEATHNA